MRRDGDQGHGLGYALVAASAVGYGFMPVFAAHAYRAGLNVPTLLFLRFLMATVAFAPLVLARRGGARPRVTRRGLVGAVVLGLVLYAGQAFTYFSAMRMVGPGLAALLLYLYPGIVALGSMVSGRLARSWRVPLVLVVALVGVALAVGKVDTSRLSAAGVGMGLATAVFYGTYILVGDRVSAGMDSRVVALVLFASATVTFGVVGAATGSLRFGFAPHGWLIVAGLALVSTILGIYLFFLGMARIGPTHASLVSLLELVTAIVASAVLLREHLTAWQWLGAGIVLAAAYLAARLTAPPDPPRQQPGSPAP